MFWIYIYFVHILIEGLKFILYVGNIPQDVYRAMLLKLMFEPSQDGKDAGKFCNIQTSVCLGTETSVCIAK